MLNKALNFYKYNIKPRYENKSGLELQPYVYDLHSERLIHTYANHKKGLYEGEIGFYDNEGTFIFKTENFIQYNVCGIAICALVYFEDYILTNSEDSRTKFESQIKWLVKNYKKLNDTTVFWEYHSKEEPNFISGIIQGFVISALLRAYQYYNDPMYLDLSKFAFNMLDTKIENGGLKLINAKYACWFEEHIESPNILNGHIYALFGIYDLYRVTKDNMYSEIFYLGVQDVKNNIKDFDLGFYTKYAASSPNPCNNSYHYTHCSQFHVLHQITGDDFFRKYNQKFKKYHSNFFYKLQNMFYIVRLYLKK